MPYSTLISAAELYPHLEDPDWAMVDCRVVLGNSSAGREAYLQSHIPGAVFIDLEGELSAPILPGKTGRHPLPDPEEFARTLSALGIGPGVQVIAYDDAGGALAAGRLWWMLRWLGFDSAAVLDGGWQEWLRRGLPVKEGSESRPSKPFEIHLRPELAVSTAEVEQLRSDPAYRLIDARAADRFRGQNEKFDPVAGHIPGAINAPYLENLTPEGVFRPKDELRGKYLSLVGDVPADHVVFYCGSGVTAVHDILAMLAAGMGEARLYPGSWSEWITHPELTVAGK